MTATANFFHSLGVVLAGSRRRVVRLSVTELLAAFAIWQLHVLAKEIDPSGDGYGSGFCAGIAVVVAYLAIIVLARFVVRVIRQAAHTQAIRAQVLYTAEAAELR